MDADDIRKMFAAFSRVTVRRMFGHESIFAPFGGSLCLWPLKEAHDLPPYLLNASDLDCLLYEAPSIHMRMLASIE
jgi:hypothetical protein